MLEALAWREKNGNAIVAPMPKKGKQKNKRKM